MSKPRFKRHYHVEALPPDLVLLFSERGPAVLKGRVLVQLVPLLEDHFAHEEEGVFTFEVDPHKRHCLLNGLDDIGSVLVANDGRFGDDIFLPLSRSPLAQRLQIGRLLAHRAAKDVRGWRAGVTQQAASIGCDSSLNV